MDQDWLLELAIDVIANATDISYIEMADRTHSVLTPAALLMRYCYPPKKLVPLNQELKAISYFLSINEAKYNKKFTVNSGFAGDTLKLMIQHGSVLSFFSDFFNASLTGVNMDTEICFHMFNVKDNSDDFHIELLTDQEVYRSVERPLAEFA